MRISSVHALLGAIGAADVGAGAGVATGGAGRVWSWLQVIAGSVKRDAAAAARKVDLIIA